MSIKNKFLSRTGSFVAATLVALGALVPAVVPMVSASGQVQSRSIEMSDSTISHAGTSYKVSFTPATTGAESLIIDFCNNSSIIGASCTAPVGMDANSSIGFTAGTGTNNWALGSGSASQVRLNMGTGSALGTSAVDFTLTGITNTSALGTFWARVYTYDCTDYGAHTGGGLCSASGTAYSSPTAIGSNIDYGGFALSTVSLINISATVMETLTFCINKTTIATGCSGISTPVALTLGSGSPKVLSITTGAGSTDDAFFQVSTNALSGAVIKMRSHNACANGGLSRDGGTTCPIPGVGASNAITTANTAAFGVNVAADTPLGSTIGTLTPTAPYSTSNQYGMDTTGGNSVSAGGGTKLADTTTGAAADLGGHLTFDAEAAATTPAGVYSADESLIATGTF